MSGQAGLGFGGEAEELCRCGHRRGDHMTGQVTACQATTPRTARTVAAACVCLMFKAKVKR